MLFDQRRSCLLYSAAILPQLRGSSVVVKCGIASSKNLAIQTYRILVRTQHRLRSLPTHDTLYRFIKIRTLEVERIVDTTPPKTPPICGQEKVCVTPGYMRDTDQMRGKQALPPDDLSI